jgi:tRNA (cmo5U34)-methyltransferase
MSSNVASAEESIEQSQYDGREDRVFDQPLEKVAPFSFNQSVAAVFDDMISRSVPLYNLVQELTGRVAARVAQSNSRIYDLGCSTATSLLRLCHTLEDGSLTFVGIDNSEPMLKQAADKVAAHGMSGRVTLVNQDIANSEIKDASLVLMHYTLQFLPVDARLDLLQRIYDGLLPGGAFLLTEKVIHEHPRMDALMVDLYYEYKRQNGYSELAISQKREALENVLVPLTASENVAMLAEAGFTCSEILLKSMNFVSVLALKV